MSLEQLLSKGWHITPEGFDLISNNGSIKNPTSLIENALNLDIKEFGASILSSELKQETTSSIVLQIQKIRNISAPRAKEESQAAPRMLKLTLTDGHSYCQGIEIATIASISRTETSPGSKVLISGAKVISGCFLITPKCCKLLGGVVPSLYEKWQIVKSLSAQVRSTGGADGAPKWVNFGQKIISMEESSRTFKSLKQTEGADTPNEFDLMRKDAICTASTGAIRKVFGGGGRSYDNSRHMKDRTRENPRNTRTKRESKDKQTDKPLKPPEKVSLFDFLETKLTLDEPPAKPTANAIPTVQQPVEEYRTHNNYANAPYQRKPFVPGFKGQNSRFPPRNTAQIQDLTNSVAKVSLNDRNTNVAANRNENGTWQWKAGDYCMAKYWEDNKFYNAQVINLTDQTCVVRFNEYGNVEEVLKTDCIPISSPEEDNQFTSNNRQPPNRGGPRDYRKPRTYNNQRFYNRNGTST